MKVLDLFCGAGGLSHGFQQAGHEVVCGVDNDAFVEKTYLANHQDADFILEDVQNLTKHDFPKVEVVVGSPPCQDLSIINANRNVSKGLVLVREYERVVKELNPRYFIMENVPPLRPFLSTGSYPTIRILNAADFGVPQIRRRVFAGNYQPPRHTHAENSQETLDGKPLHAWITVRAALGLNYDHPSFTVSATEYKGLTPKRNNRASDILWHVDKPLSFPVKATESKTYRALIRNSSQTDDWRSVEQPSNTVRGIVPPYISMRNSKVTDDWQTVDQPSGAVRGRAPDLQVRIDGRAGYLKDGLNNDGAKSLDQPSYTIRGHGTRHGILIIDDHHQTGSLTTQPRITDADSPSPTVDAREGGRPYLAIVDQPATTIQRDARMAPRGHHTRRDYPMFRRLTPEECSVLQGFPKSFIWKPKTKGVHYQMIGNAVPPPVAYAIGEMLKT